jgi:hypothetical protein
MRRVIAGALLALMLVLASPAVAGAQADAGEVSILGSEAERNGEGTNNFGGLIVGTLLLGGWTVGGVLLLRAGKRRRAESLATSS